MYSRILPILILAALFALSGCASAPKAGRKPGMESKMQTSSPVKPAGQRGAAQKEPLHPKEARQKEIEEINDWISKLNRELEMQESAVPAAAVAQPKKDDASPSGTRSNEPAVKAVPAKPETAGVSVEADKKEQKDTEPNEPGLAFLKVKVLSGDGKPASAREMSRRLTKMGYKISSIDKAPQSSFRGNTVFFAKGYEEAARHMADRLPDKAVCKPLTWPSVYHLIVVAGR